MAADFVDFQTCSVSEFDVTGQETDRRRQARILTEEDLEELKRMIAAVTGVGEGKNPAVLLRDLTFQEAVGGIAAGTIFAFGTPHDTIFEQLAKQPLVLPVYSGPELFLSSPVPTQPEIGSLVSLMLTPTWIAHDAGPVVSFALTKNGLNLFTNPLPVTYTEPPFTLTGVPVAYQALIHYAAGAVKNDSEDKPYPTGMIRAGTNVVPDYPVIDGKRAIVLGRYVDRVRIPIDGLVEPVGLNRSMQEQLIAVVNTLIAQMAFEDDERKRILASISASTLSSDDLPTLHVRIRHCSARLSEKLSNKGISVPADSPLETLIDRIDEIGAAGEDEPSLDYGDMIAELVKRIGLELFQELAKPYMNKGNNKPNKTTASVTGNVLMDFRDDDVE